MRKTKKTLFGRGASRARWRACRLREFRRSRNLRPATARPRRRPGCFSNFRWFWRSRARALSVSTRERRISGTRSLRLGVIFTTRYAHALADDAVHFLELLACVPVDTRRYSREPLSRPLWGGNRIFRASACRQQSLSHRLVWPSCKQSVTWGDHGSRTHAKDATGATVPRAPCV